MIRILASVRDAEEARMALDAGADFIDLKEPRSGALGAVDPSILAGCVEAVAGRRPVSATIGDVPLEARGVVPAVRARHAAGADYVKIGMFETEAAAAALEALSDLAHDGVRMVAVFLADAMPRRITVSDVAAAGFAGAMLDTADKTRGSLLDVASEGDLGGFVAQARRHGLMTGLAGSLDTDAACRLVPLRPDYLGFRGALCGQGDRAGRFDPARLSALRTALAAAMTRDAA